MKATKPVRTALEALQTLHESTHRHGTNNPSPVSALMEIADFLRFDLELIIDTWHERDLEMTALEIENSDLLKRLALYEKVAV